MMEHFAVGGGSGGGQADATGGGFVEGTNVRSNVQQNDFNEEEFDFCIDQLFNGNHEQSRTALECLVEDTDQLSQYHMEGFAEVVKKKDWQKQLDQPSTSRENTPSLQTQPKPQWKIAILRKFREELEKNPAKQQKVIRKVRDYHKERWQRITEAEKDAFRVRHREELSAEKKRVLQRKHYQRIKQDKAKMDKRRASCRKYYANLKSTESNQYECKFSNCAKSFVRKHHLIQHERVHLANKPFSCSWPNCQFTSEQRNNVLLHVRTRHFHLPKTQKQQARLKIVYNRDPAEFVQVDHELASRRVE